MTNRDVALLLLLGVASAGAQSTKVGITNTAGNVDARALFSRPTGAFTAEIRYSGDATRATAQAFPCDDGAGCVVAWDCGRLVTIRVGAETRTLACVSD